MYSHVACDVMKERTLYLLKPSSLIWHLMPYLFLFIFDFRRLYIASEIPEDNVSDSTIQYLFKEFRTKEYQNLLPSFYI